MNLKSEYVFNGIARLSYGWHNPNHAAAVLVTLFPFIWAAEQIVKSKEGSRLVRCLLWLVELATGCLLALTFSRGAAVAWFVALAVFGIDVRKLSAWRRSIQVNWRFVSLRLAASIVVLVATGLSKRFQIIAAGDESVLHRIDLWKGGLLLIAGSPLRGWGSGYSGVAYSQWFQPITSELRPGGMVNTYLHVGTEFGLPFLILLLVLIFFPFMLCRAVRDSASTKDDTVLLGCSSAIAALAVAALFTSLDAVTSVDLLGLAVIAISFLVARRSATRRVVLRQFVSSVLVSVGLTMALFGLALFQARRLDWTVRRKGSGVVELKRKHPAANAITVAYLPDGRVLGDFYGMAIRAALSEKDREISLIDVVPPGEPLEGASLPPVDIAFVFGPRALEVSGISTKAKLFLVFPTNAVPKVWSPAPECVLLPQVDELGFSGRWQQWAVNNHYNVRIIPEAGQQLVALWPQIFRQCVSPAQKSD